LGRPFATRLAFRKGRKELSLRFEMPRPIGQPYVVRASDHFAALVLRLFAADKVQSRRW